MDSWTIFFIGFIVGGIIVSVGYYYIMSITFGQAVNYNGDVVQIKWSNIEGVACIKSAIDLTVNKTLNYSALSDLAAYQNLYGAPLCSR